MRHGTAIAALAAAMTVGLTAAATAETVNGVTILRGRPSTAETVESGIGSGSTTPPGNPYYRADQSGAVNSVHTGSANAGGQFNNLPPGAGR